MPHLRQFLNQGIQTSYDDIQRLRLRMLNFDTLMGILIPAMAFLISFYYGFYSTVSILTLILFVVLSAIAYFLNSHFYHALAAIFFLGCISIALLTVTLVFGKDTELHFFFLPVSISSFIYYLRWKSMVWFFFAIQLMAFLFLYYLPFEPYFHWEEAKVNIIAKSNMALVTLLLGTKIITFAQLSLRLLVQLQDREAKFRNIFENSQIGIAIAERMDSFSEVNPAFCQMLGYHREEFLNLSFQHITAPEDIALSMAQIKKIMANPHETVKVQKSYLHKAGYRIRATSVLTGIHNKQGHFKGIMVNTQDVTEQYEAEKALKDSHALLSATLESTADGILAIDLNDQITRYNQKFLDIWNIPVSLIEKNKRQLVLAYVKEQLTDTNAFMQSVKAYYTTPDIVQFDVLDFKDGRIIERYTQPQWIDNQIVGRVISFRDVTARKQQEQIIQENIALVNQKNQELEKYIESNLQLENFAYIASHDLKAPVRTIISFSQLLKRSAEERLLDNEKDFLGFIIGATRNMQDLIEALLRYARVNTQEHRPSTIQIRQLVQEIEGELYAVLDETQANIEVKDLPKTIQGDATKIRQLFQNLIQNAIKFQDPGIKPIVQISGKEAEKHWTFAIADNGIGIDAAFHEKIFLLFRKLHNNEAYTGTGIGLALCKKIVEHHQGEIWLESTPGKGTTFYFTIKKAESDYADSAS